MKKFTLLFAFMAAFALSACTDDAITVSGGDVAGGDDVDTVSTDFVYADEFYAQELADRIKDRVFFKLDSSSLDAAAIETVKAQIEWLKANPSKKITLEGHCDERGTREYNLGLGDRRAAAVKKYMMARGIAASRIRTVSYGKERPAILGNNEAAWAQNRRTVTVIRD